MKRPRRFFKSWLGRDIKAYLALKRAMGRKYLGEESTLRYLDRFVAQCFPFGVGIYPADPGNGGLPCSNTTNAPSMGAWIHLGMSLDEINQLPVPEWKKILLRTLMYYGAYINDTGAGGYFQWQLESGNQYISTNAPTNPWMTLATTLAGQANTDWFACNPPDQDCVAGGYKGLFRDTDDFTAPDTWKTRVWQRLEVLPPPAH